MEGTVKDAARSKWKLSQRHKRGRGGRFEGAGRGGRHRVAGSTQDLGSNDDRYLDSEDEGAASGEPAGGPARKSLGADLAELLENADAYDVGFYHRSRANLLEEYGLPPGEAASYQGLSFDLKGLAACLALLPRNELLGTDAFDEENEEEEDGEEASKAAQHAQQQQANAVQRAQHSQLAQQAQQQHPEHAAQHTQQTQPAQRAQQQQQAVAGPHVAQAARQVPLPPASAAAVAVSSSAAGSSQAQQPASLGYALAERTTAAQGSGMSPAPLLGAAAGGPVVGAAATAAAASRAAAAGADEARDSYAPPLQQPSKEQQQKPQQPQQQRAALGTPAGALAQRQTKAMALPVSVAQQPATAKAPAPAAAELDEDLDFLLSLMDVPPAQHAQQAQQPVSSARPLAAAPAVPMPLQGPQQAAAGVGPVGAGGGATQTLLPGSGVLGAEGGVAQISAPQQQEQSLDEWLDAL